MSNSPPLAGRYAFHGSIHTGGDAPTWLVVDEKSGQEYLAELVDMRVALQLSSGKGLQHLHLSGIVDLIQRPAKEQVPFDVPKGTSVLLSEYVAGRSLHEEIQMGPLPAFRAAVWGRRLAAAVELLHSKKSVHGRINPRCVIVDPTAGRAVSPVLSRVWSPLLASFVSPERVRGEPPSQLDDVWALHACLYAMLTGEPPWRGDSATDIVEQMASDAPAPLSMFGLDEPELQVLLDRGLRHEKRERSKTAKSLREALEAWELDPATVPEADSAGVPLPGAMPRPDASGRPKAIIKNAALLFDDGELPDRFSITRLASEPPAPGDEPPAVSAVEDPASDEVAEREESGESIPVPGSISELPISMSDFPSEGELIAPSSEEPTEPAEIPADLKPEPFPEPEFAAQPEITTTRRSVRFSVNPFEKKFPTALVAVILLALVAVGLGAFVWQERELQLAAAVIAAQPPPGASSAAPKLIPPTAPTQEPRVRREECVHAHFGSATFETRPDVAFVCGDKDFREVATELYRLAYLPKAAAEDGQEELDTRDNVDIVRGAGFIRGSGMAWYEMPATSIIRNTCCPTAAPVRLPETRGWCEQIQTVVRSMAQESNGVRDLGPLLKRFDKAVFCLYANGLRKPYKYRKSPRKANRLEFQRFLGLAAEAGAVF